MNKLGKVIVQVVRAILATPFFVAGELLRAASKFLLGISDAIVEVKW